MKCFILLFILASAMTRAGGQAFSDFDSKTDFKKYTTYAWIAPGDSILNRPRSDKPFGGAIMYFANLELKKRGMAVDTLHPQALFLFNTRVEDHVRYSQSPTLSVGLAVGGPGYYAGGMAPVAGGKVTEIPYREGTMAFEMYDTSTGKLIWRGGTRKDFENPDISQLIADAAHKIFKKFPKKIAK